MLWSARHDKRIASWIGTIANGRPSIELGNLRKVARIELLSARHEPKNERWFGRNAIKRRNIDVWIVKIKSSWMNEIEWIMRPGELNVNLSFNLGSRRVAVPLRFKF